MRAEHWWHCPDWLSYGQTDFHSFSADMEYEHMKHQMLLSIRTGLELAKSTMNNRPDVVFALLQDVIGSNPRLMMVTAVRYVYMHAQHLSEQMKEEERENNIRRMNTKLVEKMQNRQWVLPPLPTGPRL